MSTDKKPDDDMAAILRKAKVTLGARQQEKDTERRETKKSLFEQLRSIGTFMDRASGTASWIYNNVLTPIGHVLNPMLGWAWRGYKSAWNSFTTYKDKDGDVRFSKGRAGIMALGTGYGLYIAPALIAGALAGTFNMMADTALYATTYERQTMYLSNAQEIDSNNDQWSVAGCKTDKCSDESTVYYRIDKGWFKDIWSLYNKGMLHFPDNIGGSVPPGLNKCEIGSYGLRMRFPFRLYPTILRIDNCTPVSQVSPMKPEVIKPMVPQ